MSSKLQRTQPAPSFATLVQAFFAEYLIEQRALSPRTVAAYRDAFMLFLAFTQAHLGKSPATLGLADITPELILAFLDHLEQERHNTVRSRNARLAALRAFLKFASHRDHLLLGLLYNTGARVSEIVAVTVADVVLDGAAYVHLHGKRRKQRAVPLWRSTVQEIRAWLRLNPQLGAISVLLPNRDGDAMTRSNVTQRLAIAVQTASMINSDLAKRRISPRTIRHTTAMHLLQSGVDISVIALWLGHESPTTTHMYVEADLAMKDRALARLQEPDTQMCRYQAPDVLIRFLKAL